MEEVKRVTTTRKPKKTTTILLVIAGILGIGLIGAAIYFYAIGDTTERETSAKTTCACYYIDPAVISECGDPRRGFIFETTTVTGDETCKTTCSTSNLSVNSLNSTTEQDLYQICQLQTVLDARCTGMTVKDQDGLIVTGDISSTDEITIEADFDQEYTDYKFVINNEDVEPDIISPDKLTIKKTLSDLSSTTISIVATATDSNGDQINSPLCKRLIEIDQAGTSNVNDIQVQTRQDTDTYKVSQIQIGIGNISEDSDLSIEFSFEGTLTDLLMNSGFTIDSEKGEITILEQDLYDSTNFSTDTTFSQLNGMEGEIDITAEVMVGTSLVGSASGAFTFPAISDTTTEEEQAEESDFTVSKTSNVECVERVSPDNTAQFTLTATNNSSTAQKMTSIKDKLPLGFTYVESSSQINGVSVTDDDYVTVSDVGDTQEIVWQKTDGWSIASGQSITIVFQSEAGEDALTGSNQNEVIITPEEIPEDPTSLRAEYVILVAQDCDNPEDTTDQTTTDTSTTPSTGLLDTILGKIIAGLITLIIGWYIYSKPLGKVLVEKLVESGIYKEAEVTSWRIFKPKKYFEAKVLRKIKKK